MNFIELKRPLLFVDHRQTGVALSCPRLLCGNKTKGVFIETFY